uniref:Pleckstrin homology domain-containing family F member 2 n=1 Tax=Schistocephalus solidus TaxID=70667 RepID=A0A0V0J4S5_SCHSO
MDSSPADAFDQNSAPNNVSPTAAVQSGQMKSTDLAGRLEETRTRETIAAQNLLNLPPNPNQKLLARGLLMKICRKKPKYRTFFLFNDILVYTSNIVYGKSFSEPTIFPLEEVSIKNVNDSGIFRNGFIIQTPRKSFTVYATIADEKRRWMEGIQFYANEAQKRTGKFYPQPDASVIQKCPVWIPNSEAMCCMVCLDTEFTVVQRRHHCRNCGRVVCGKCSQYRWVLPSQCPNQVRVCADCHEKLRAEQLAEKAKAHQAPTDPLRPTAGVAALQAMPPSSAASINHSGLPEFAPPSWNPKLLGDSDDDPHSESSSDISGLADQIADSRYLR